MSSTYLVYSSTYLRHLRDLCSGRLFILEFDMDLNSIKLDARSNDMDQHRPTSLRGKPRKLFLTTFVVSLVLTGAVLIAYLQYDQAESNQGAEILRTLAAADGLLVTAVVNGHLSPDGKDMMIQVFAVPKTADGDAAMMFDLFATLKMTSGLRYNFTISNERAMYTLIDPSDRVVHSACLESSDAPPLKMIAQAFLGAKVESLDEGTTTGPYGMSCATGRVIVATWSGIDFSYCMLSDGQLSQIYAPFMDTYIDYLDASQIDAVRERMRYVDQATLAACTPLDFESIVEDVNLERKLAEVVMLEQELSLDAIIWSSLTVGGMESFVLSTFNAVNSIGSLLNSYDQGFTGLQSATLRNRRRALKKAKASPATKASTPSKAKPSPAAKAAPAPSPAAKAAPAPSPAAKEDKKSAAKEDKKSASKEDKKSAAKEEKTSASKKEKEKKTEDTKKKEKDKKDKKSSKKGQKISAATAVATTPTAIAEAEWETVVVPNYVTGLTFRRPCVFIHGSGFSSAGSFLKDTHERAWGDIASDTKFPLYCSDVKFIHLDTQTFRWYTSWLTQATCELLLMAEPRNFAEPNTNTDRSVDHVIVITHGTAALQLGAGIENGHCTIGTTSRWIALNPPLEGSKIIEQISARQCTLKMKDYAAAQLAVDNTGLNRLFSVFRDCTANQPVGQALGPWSDYLNASSIPQDVVKYNDVTKTAAMNIDAVLCGKNPGLLGTDRVMLDYLRKVLLIDVSDSDGIVDYASCARYQELKQVVGEEFQFKRNTKGLLYQTQVGHYDFMLTRDSVLYASTRPMEWFQNLNLYGIDPALQTVETCKCDAGFCPKSQLCGSCLQTYGPMRNDRFCYDAKVSQQSCEEASRSATDDSEFKWCGEDNPWTSSRLALTNTDTSKLTLSSKSWSLCKTLDRPCLYQSPNAKDQCVSASSRFSNNGRVQCIYPSTCTNSNVCYDEALCTCISLNAPCLDATTNLCKATVNGTCPDSTDTMCPAKLHEQCGGEHWTGSTACPEQSRCVAKTALYSICELDEESTCSASGAQCGGLTFLGNSTCCDPNFACETVVGSYMECRPNCPIASPCYFEGKCSTMENANSCSPGSICAVPEVCDLNAFEYIDVNMTTTWDTEFMTEVDPSRILYGYTIVNPNGRSASQRLNGNSGSSQGQGNSNNNKKNS